MPETKQVTTRVLPGFMELLPAGQIQFERMRSSIQASFERFGFVPLVTPIIERSEVLLSKAGGETEKQIYRFTKGENDLALRFDLTVPVARYVSEHFNQLTFPFRRYAIGTVYRGERPQKGRFREFYQCDIDIIGLGELSLVNDAEILSVIYTTFVNLELPDFTVRINNRKVLNGLFASLGVAPLAVEIMRLIDKREKIGEAAFRGSLAELGITPQVIDRLDEFVQIRGSNAEVIAGLQAMGIQNELFAAGLRDLAEVARSVEYLGVPLKNFAIDLSIARGLDYYTGTVYETILNDYPEFGSICSGGRYDNLAEQYIDQKLPGVGISIGLTRLFDQLSDAGLVKPGAFYRDASPGGADGPGSQDPAGNRLLPARSRRPDGGLSRRGPPQENAELCQQAGDPLRGHYRRGRGQGRPVQPQEHADRGAVQSECRAADRAGQERLIRRAAAHGRAGLERSLAFTRITPARTSRPPSSAGRSGRSPSQIQAIRMATAGTR